MIEVVSKYKHKETSFDIYIGRGSPIGNPYTSIKDKKTKADYICETREESIEKYREWLIGKLIDKDKKVCDEMNLIWKMARKGDVYLVCFCKPKDCHGDIVKEIVEEHL